MLFHRRGLLWLGSAVRYTNIVNTHEAVPLRYDFDDSVCLLFSECTDVQFK